MFDDAHPLSLHDTFNFSCSKTVPCFNECCGDLNQFLTPYDILRLKTNRGLTSSVFLERYTSQHSGPESGLPVITFKTDYSAERECPFVTPGGCSVYDDRPSSCRTYPLARIITRSRETRIINEQFMLIKEPHCLGFNEGKKQTVREWIESQALGVYNEMNDRLMEIISLKNQKIPGPLDLKSRHMFHLACYDLDSFRIHVFEEGILDNTSVDPDRCESAKTDDTALLDLGLSWIKQALFQNK